MPVILDRRVSVSCGPDVKLSVLESVSVGRKLRLFIDI